MAGQTPGRVFADETDAPQTAVAWYGHRAFVVGLADAQARQQMADWWHSVVLYEKAQSRLEGLVLHVDTAWSEQITAVCTPPAPQVYSRRAYRLDARGGSWAVDQPAGFRLQLGMAQQKLEELEQRPQK